MGELIDSQFLRGTLVLFTLGGSSVLGLFVYSWLEAGGIQFFMRLTRGESNKLSDLVRGAAWVWTLFGFNLLWTTLFLMLCAICASPWLGISALICKGGIKSEAFAASCFYILAITSVAVRIGLSFLCLTPHFIIDRRMGLCASLSASQRHMQGNKRRWVGTYLVAGILAIAFTTFTCSLGALFVLPFFMLLAAVVYGAATGEPLDSSSGKSRQ